MGDFSRNPDDRLADSVAKHYVGVRLQQGVPLLDSDWNELEDLRRHETETVGTWFIGDGVPVGSDGFRIVAVTDANDFEIRQGLCIVSGKVTHNDADVRYTTQPLFDDATLDTPLPALSTPGADTEYIVYLDVWEREVGAQEDTDLIDPRIGVETTVRLQRVWAVRLAEVPGDVALLDNPPDGHFFYQLARLNRQGGDDNITSDMIEDLRDTQVSIRRRIEVFNAAGTVVVDDADFRLTLETTRNNVFAFMRYITTEFNPISAHMTAAEVLGMQAAEHIAQTAEAGLSLMSSQVLANRGALNFLAQLYNAENHFMEVWRDFVLDLGGTPKKYVTYESFIDRLDQRLNDPLVGTNLGLLPALVAENLEAATLMQGEIARLFGEASASIPRGSIDVFLSRSPAGTLNQGDIVIFEYLVRSFTTLADTYTVTILPVTGWTRRVVDENGTAVPANRITIGPNGSEDETIFIEVVVGTGTSDLQLQVTSDGNPVEVTQTTTIATLTEGQPAPGGENQIRLEIDTVVPGSHDPGTNTITLPDTGTTFLSINAFNETDDILTLDLSHAFEDEVGDWSATLATDLQVPANASSSTSVQITPGTGAVSAVFVVTASVTIGGTLVTAQINPTLIVEP